jgi:hypothetical protein
MAFAHFGASRREVFENRLIVVVVRELLRALSKDVAADEFGYALRDTYNRRQIKYAEYTVLIPSEGKPLNGTLYWEFSKILFGFLNDNNPAMLMFLNVLVADFTKIILNDALKVKEVFES